MNITRFALSAAAVAGALAMTPAAHAGSLSPRLEQLSAHHATAAQKVTRTAEAPLHTAAGGLEPHVNASGEVQVYIHYRIGRQPADAALQMLGARRIRSALGVIQAWVPVGKLHQLAGLPGVSRVGLPAYMIVRGLGGAQPRADTCSAVASGISIDSQGIAAEKVATLQNDGFKGSGVKVGIISDGVDCLSSSQTGGYLPNNVWVDSSLAGSGDEGTAMLEEVHAMAPDAQLGFCGPGTTVEFVTCYDDFAAWGADIISDDLGFPLAFFYNSSDITGDFLNSIKTFAQNHPDISLVAAVGNDRLDYYQGDYAASSATPSIGLTPTGYTPEPGGTTGRTYQAAMDFNGNPYEGVSFQLPKGQSSLFMLTWNDPRNGPYDDLDLYLVDSSGNFVDASTYDETVDSTVAPSSASWNPPAELVQYTNNSGGTQNLKLFVMCYVCNQTSNLLVKLTGTMDGGGTFAVTANGGVYGHAALADEISTAAASLRSSSSSTAQIESFSQSGPFTGGDWQSGTTTTLKPDLTGIDGVLVSGAGGFGVSNSGGPGAYFYGTSAASPNVASVIALLRGAAPNAAADANGWAQLLINNANSSALSNYSVARGGSGLVDAAAAWKAIDGTITVAITTPSGSPAPVDPNTDVQFGATCNYTGSEILNYNWSFGNNSGIPNSTKLTPDPVQYANGGVYTVKFTCAEKYQSKSAQKTVAVQAAAIAKDQSLTTAYETAATGTFSGSDVGGNQVSYEIVRQPAHGTVQSNGSSSFVYTPNDGYSGSDSFTYDIDNGVMKSNTATVSVTVNAKPQPKPTGGGGGGGAFGLGGLAALLGLAGLAAVRRRR